MEGKNQLLGQEDGRAIRAKQRLYWYHRLAVALVAILFLRSTWSFFAPSPHHHSVEEAIRRYDGESIEWKLCATNNGHDLECASIDVPMDHFNAATSGDKTFSIPLIRLRGSKATRNLLVNPGGPGGSGVEFVFRLGGFVKSIVGDDLHIVGFDPRGINGSRPEALCYPDAMTRMQRSQICVSDHSQFDPELYSWTENFVQACADTTGAEHIKYVNTPQTAADMNSILDALGQDAMVYWGFSYGTVLGQTYASMFPERSERVVIDGVVNLFDWYEEMITLEGLVDAEKALTGFFDKCMKEGEACPLAHLAEDAAKLEDKVMAAVNALKENPADVYLSNTDYGSLIYGTMLSAIWTTLLKPAEWYVLADSLAQLVQGNATDAFERYGLKGYFVPEFFDHNAIVANNDHITGKDNWPQKGELVKWFQPFLNASIFSTGAAREFYLASQWRLPTTHSFKPSRRVATKHPLLILSQTYDPATPLVSARLARDTFEGSRLVECLGVGHCTTAIHSACSAKLVREFLVDGTLPEEDVQCKVDGKYFIPLEEKEKIMLRGASDGASDEERLWAAQLGLSNGLTPPRF
ncbi:uncharacterized protein LMH87_008954 [Akanthomyces muscarius]|uniref:Alpha/beta-hydrolase n=1 Tax=Akanthomyces muscarius TaxID=2231603 RepID=A0A9W8QI79_AKAMU|nr:uncharacterized protein LMH87_008954 [Akanthomyces muscarius]KAJ4158428.1 hypothetical protein LMH87_008954 [Akanthomyces muscarius]